MNGSLAQAREDSIATSTKIVADVFTSLPESLPTEPIAVAAKIIGKQHTLLAVVVCWRTFIKILLAGKQAASVFALITSLTTG